MCETPRTAEDTAALVRGRTTSRAAVHVSKRIKQKQKRTCACARTGLGAAWRAFRDFRAWPLAGPPPRHRAVARARPPWRAHGAATGLPWCAHAHQPMRMPRVGGSRAPLAQANGRGEGARTAAVGGECPDAGLIPACHVFLGHRVVRVLPEHTAHLRPNPGAGAGEARIRVGWVPAGGRRRARTAPVAP